MPRLDIDDKQLAAIRSEIGYRLRAELDRDRRPLPPQLVRLVHAVDDTRQQRRLPSIVSDRHRDGGNE